MICDKFNNLSPLEKVLFVGELIHAVQFDETSYTIGQEIISLAKRKGIFEGVVINPIANEDLDRKIKDSL